MKILIKSIIAIVLIAFVSSCGNSTAEIVITPDGDQMKFAVTSFEVKAGQEVQLIMNNTATSEAMKHNVVILNDASKINEVGIQAMSATNYVPDHPAIIAATGMAGPGESTAVTFTAPSKSGIYTYICTFPGHYTMMQGQMIVK